MFNLIEVLGAIAGCCTTCAFFPQAIQVFKTHSVQDISVLMYVIYCLGLVLWIIYGIYLHNLINVL